MKPFPCLVPAITYLILGWLGCPLLAGTPQTLTFPAITNKVSTDAPFLLTATASSGLPVIYSVASTGGVAGVSGNTVTLAGTAGSVTIKAEQSGDATHDPAAPVTRTFVVMDTLPFAQLAAGPAATHSGGIRTDGTLWTWGSNGNGRLGDGTTNNRNTPVQVSVGSTWLHVGVGGSHTVAVKADGTLWAWGLNTNGQLGMGDTTQRTSPAQVGTDTTWRWVATGTSHTLAVKTDGSLWAWGLNTNGQLGLGDTTQRTAPVRVGTGNDWQSITAGNAHSVGLKTGGIVWAWGLNSNGQIGDGTTTQREAPVQVGLDPDWQSVAAGGTHTVARKAGGTLWAWGNNTNGRLGDGTTTQRNSPVQVGSATDWHSVAAGGSHTLARKSGGTLWTWGANSNGQIGDGTVNQRTSPVQIGTDANWQLLAAGVGHVLASRQDGTLWGWGLGTTAQTASISLPASQQAALGGALALSAATGESHSLAVKADGTLWAWGNNGNGRLGDGTTTQRVSPVQVGSVTTWQKVAAGRTHSLGIRSNGTLWAWGNNATGQLGLGDTTQRTSPVQVGAATDWVAVAPGDGHTLAVNSAGELWAWGDNASGQLGLGDTAQRNSPVRVGSASDWLAVSAGATHSLAVRTVGTLWTWGGNSDGQLGLGDTTQRSSPVQVGAETLWQSVSAGALHSLAVRTDRTLWAWGSNTNGRLGDGSNTRRTSPVQVNAETIWLAAVAGTSHSMGLKTDGTLWAWGNNQTGQHGNGTVTESTLPQQVGGARGWTLLSTSSAANQTLASRESGLWAIGSNSQGQAPGTDVGRFVPRLSLPARASQTISVTPFVYSTGVAVPVNATATSGLPLTLAVSGPATLNGTSLTVTGPGDVILDVWQSGDDNAWQHSTLRSIVVSPDIRVEHPSGRTLTDGGDQIAFGSFVVATASTAKTVTITNTSQISDLTGLTITKDGPHQGDFTIDMTGMAASLVPGGSTSFTVSFTPTAAGDRDAAFHIASNVSGTKSSFDVVLKGIGVDTANQIQPGMLRSVNSDDAILSGASTFGINASNTIVTQGASWWNTATSTPTPAFAEKYGAAQGIGPGVVRFPAGADANLWDWRAGMLLPLDSSVKLLPQKLVGNPVIPPATSGPVMKPDTQPLTLSVLKKSFLDTVPGAEVIWLLNMLTYSEDQTRQLANGQPWSSDPIQYQVEMLLEALSLGMAVKYIELGNEFYLDGNPDYISAYQNPSSIALPQSRGFNYGNLCKYWMAQIRARLTAAGRGAEAAALQFGVIAYENEASTWNGDVRSGLTAPALANLIGNDGPVTHYHLCPHPYSGSGFTVEIPPAPGAVYPEIPLDFSNVGGANTIPQILSQALITMGSKKAFSRSTNSSGSFTALESLGANSFLNQYLPDAQSRLWFTEYNLQDRKVPIHGTWLHGFYDGLQSLLMLENEKTRFAVNFTTMGPALFSAIFKNMGYTNNNAFRIGAVVVDGTEHFYRPYTNPPVPVEDGYTAVGQTFRLITDAARGMSQARQLTFFGEPGIDNSQGPNFVSYVKSGIEYRYASLYGFAFANHASNPTQASAVVLNLGDNPLTLNMSSAFPSGGVFRVRESMGPQEYYQPVPGGVIYPRYYPGVYIYGASKPGSRAPVELWSSENISGPADDRTAVQFRPYSITELYWESAPPLTALQSWRQTYFGTTADSGNAADTFDFDKDGLVNLLEWAAGLNPTLSSTLPTPVVRNGGNIEFIYTRSQSAANAGAVFSVEWSDTLAANDWSTTGVSQTELTNNGTLQQMKATLPAGPIGRRFVRLRVDAPPP